MLNISMYVIAISNCLKLPWHLSIGNTMVILIRQKAKSYTLMVASINGIFVALFICIYRHEQIYIYSAFLRLVTESHMAQSNIIYLGVSDSRKRNIITLKRFINDD